MTDCCLVDLIDVTLVNLSIISFSLFDIMPFTPMHCKMEFFSIYRGTSLWPPCDLLLTSFSFLHCINCKSPLLWVSHWYGQKRHQHDCGVIIILVISSQAELLLLVSAILAKWPVPTGTLKLGHAQKWNIFKTVSIHLKVNTDLAEMKYWETEWMAHWWLAN